MKNKNDIRERLHPLENKTVEIILSKESAMQEKPMPWFEKEGKLRPAFIIEASAKKWDSKTFWEYEKFLLETNITNQALWEIYLKRYQRYQREELIKPEVYDELACTNNDIKDWMGSKKGEYTDKLAFFKEYLPMAMDTLGKKEKAVIKGIFWQNKSERQLAKEFFLSRRSIADYKKRGMERIKKFLLAVYEELHPEETYKKNQRGGFENDIRTNNADVPLVDE